MSKSNGQERFIPAAFLVTLATVFRDTPQLCAMFRLLNPRLFKRRISRYWVIVVTSFICIHTKVCIYSIKETICNRAQSGSELPEFAAPILRNSSSQSPDRWLKEPRNNQPGLGPDPLPAGDIFRGAFILISKRQILRLPIN